MSPPELFPTVTITNLTEEDRKHSDAIESNISVGIASLLEIETERKSNITYNDFIFSFPTDDTLQKEPHPEMVPIHISVDCLYLEYLGEKAPKIRDKIAEMVGREFMTQLSRYRRQGKPPHVQVDVREFDIDKNGVWSSEE